MSHRLLSHTEVSTALTCEARPGGCYIEAVTGMGSSYASRVSRGIARGHS